jgi:RNA polymerase sigma-70 factor, ECF subfamily
MDPRRDDCARQLAVARAGSKEALGELLEVCRAYLLKIAAECLDPKLISKADAADMVQETFLEAHRDFVHFRGADESALRAWLRRLLLNNVANFFRRFRTGGKRAVDLEVAVGADALAARIWGVSSDPAPSDRVSAEEQVQLLDRALTRLPDEYRRVLHLRYREQRSYEEIGGEMLFTSNAARKLATRAVRALQLQFERRPNRAG